MSNDTRNRLAELREWLNFVITIIGAVAIVYLNLRFENQRLEIRNEVKENFVSKADWQANLTALTATDAKLWEHQSGLADTLNKNVQEINLKLQHIEDSLPRTK